MSYSTQEILDSKIKRGRVFLEKLEKASLNGFEENKKLLFKLIEENKNTDYGKKYNFENIKTIEDYFKNVPFSEYEDYEDVEKYNIIRLLPIHGLCDDDCGHLPDRKRDWRLCRPIPSEGLDSHRGHGHGCLQRGSQLFARKAW